MILTPGIRAATISNFDLALLTIDSRHPEDLSPIDGLASHLALLDSASPRILNRTPYCHQTKAPEGGTFKVYASLTRLGSNTQRLLGHGRPHLLEIAGCGEWGVVDGTFRNFTEAIYLECGV